MKMYITNRDSRRVCVVVDANEPEQDKLVFVMHGLGGSKDEPHIRAMADAFLETGHRVVRFDTTNTYGESEGDYQNATITNYYEDLEDVIAWASTQDWYVEPFVLCGHSLGGISTGLYAEKYPYRVKALAPISTVVSGQLSFDAYKLTDRLGSLEEWRKQGVLITKSHDGMREKRLKWSHMEDRLKYDLLPATNKLQMPILLVVGEKDDPTPPEHQKILYKALPGVKELHVIAGAQHSFYEPHEQVELKQLVKSWASSL